MIERDRKTNKEREIERERRTERERERDKWNWSVRERERERKVLSWSERVAVRVFMVALTLTLGHRSSLSQASMLQREKRTGRLRMKTKWDLPCFLFSFSFFDSFFFNFLLITNFFFLKRAKLNSGSNWDLTKYYIDKNWNLKDWNNKTKS